MGEAKRKQQDIDEEQSLQERMIDCIELALNQELNLEGIIYDTLMSGADTHDIPLDDFKPFYMPNKDWQQLPEFVKYFFMRGEYNKDVFELYNSNIDAYTGLYITCTLLFEEDELTESINHVKKFVENTKKQKIAQPMRRLLVELGNSEYHLEFLLKVFKKVVNNPRCINPAGDTLKQL